MYVIVERGGWLGKKITSKVGEITVKNIKPQKSTLAHPLIWKIESKCVQKRENNILWTEGLDKRE